MSVLDVASYRWRRYFSGVEMQAERLTRGTLTLVIR